MNILMNKFRTVLVLTRFLQLVLSTSHMIHWLSMADKADSFDFPVVMYEDDKEIPPCNKCQLLCQYQANQLPGHYVKIAGNCITANAPMDDDDIYLQYTTFNDNSSDQLICLSDSSKQHVLTYDVNAKNPVFHVKSLDLNSIMTIKDAQAKAIVFVMTTTYQIPNGPSMVSSIRPWLPQSTNKTKPYLAFKDDGSVMDPGSSLKDSNADRRKFYFFSF